MSRRLSLVRHRYNAAQILAEILRDELNDDDDVGDQLDDSSESEDDVVEDVVEDADIVPDEFGDDEVAESTVTAVSDTSSTASNSAEKNNGAEFSACSDADDTLTLRQFESTDADDDGKSDDDGAESDNGDDVIWSRCGSVAWRKTARTTSRHPTRNILTDEPGLPTNTTFNNIADSFKVFADDENGGSYSDLGNSPRK